ncbi:MAG: IS21-like element helper ATPase IstB [Candidatus Latescibacterota bacterium]
MLTEPTMEKLYAMKLNGMAEAWQEQQQQPQSSDLSFDDRLAMLVERQWLWKENRALVTRLQYARLKEAACLEDIDYRHPRGLKRAAIDQLASCDWIRHHRHCLITGPTGAGKTYLACALAHKACREGFRTLYFYLPKLFRQLTLAQADGSLTRLLKKLARVDLLVVDDWGLTPLEPDQYRLFLEILDDRQGSGANLLTSQYPINTWHQRIGDPTVGDAILDRLVHNAYRLELSGDSLRKQKGKAA